jgi:RHS repeat-associated protein
MLSQSDANGISTSYSYDDPLGRRRKVTFALGTSQETQMAYSYPSMTEVDVASDEHTAGDQLLKSRSVSDGVGHVISQTDPSGATQVFHYNSAGQLDWMTNPSGSSGDFTNGITSFNYDALGRQTMQCNSDNGSGNTCIAGTSYRQWTYSGNVTTIYDELRNSRQETYDSLGRLKNVVEPGGASTDYSYDALGNMISVQQWGIAGESPRTRRFKYDALSRLLWSQNPETGVTCYGHGDGTTAGCQSDGYDANGNLIYKTEPVTDTVHWTIAYGYDALDRMISKTAPDGADDTDFVYVYDQGTNGIGRLTQERHAMDSFSGTMFSYDSIGHVTGTNWYDYAAQSWKAGMQNVKYDLAGNLTQLTYPDGKIMSQIWDAAGHLSGVYSGAVEQIGTPNAKPYVSSIQYWPNGSVKSELFGNGITQTFGVNNRLQPCSQQATSALLPGTSLLDRKLFYNSGAYTSLPAEVNCGNAAYNTGNIYSITEGFTSENFGYDALRRLVGAYSMNRASGQYNFQYYYDSFGNMTSRDWSKAPRDWNVDPATNRLSTNTDLASGLPPYYANGNLWHTQGALGMHTFAYTAEGYLRSIDNFSKGSYLYNGEGQRTLAVRNDDGTSEASHTEYVYLNGQMMESIDDKYGVTDQIYANGRRIAQVANSKNLLHIHMNATGASCPLTLAASSTPVGLTLATGDHLALSIAGTSGLQVGAGMAATNSSGAIELVDPHDQNGNDMAFMSPSGSDWLHEVGDLSGFVGDQVVYSGIGLLSDHPGPVDLWVKDEVVVHSDGSFTPLITNGSVTLTPMNPVDFSTGTPLSTTGQNLCAGTGVTLDFNPVSMNTAEGATYYLADQVGTNKEELSAGGWPVWKGYFTPFGQEFIGGNVQTTVDNDDADGTTSPYKFTSKERDTESGLDYFGARYYGSSMGRFLSPDDGTDQNPNDPQSWNLYTYVRSNPLLNTDPTGRTCQTNSSDRATYDDMDGKGCATVDIQNQERALSGAYDARVNSTDGDVSYQLASAVANLTDRDSLLDTAAHAYPIALGVLSVAQGVGLVGQAISDAKNVSEDEAPTVHMGKQGKHIKGHNNFIPGRSELTADPNTLASKAGTGTPVDPSVPRGTPGFKERVDFGQVIGDYVDSSGNRAPTTKGIIVYGSDGIHIIPARP